MPKLCSTKSRTLAATVLAAMVLALLSGCSDDRTAERPKTTGSHVWRGQTDMLFEAQDRAKDINTQLGVQEAAIERARRGD